MNAMTFKILIENFPSYQGIDPTVHAAHIKLRRGTAGAGHGFQDFHNLDRYRLVQSDDAWFRLFEFMNRYLKE
ncbi:MAG: hypothetical protein ACJAXW_003499 [Candidatus Azotimanducaceae bacterium]|jgi:hypothetical protein